MALVTVETLPQNLLEAVNLALGYMREPPIDDLALINTSYAVEQAYRAVISTTRAIQRRGFMFNVGKLTITPVLDVASGEYRVLAPDGATKVEADQESFTYDRFGPRPMLIGFKNYDETAYVQYIVDARNGPQSRDWKSAAPTDIAVTYTLAFDALPEAAKAVVSLEAAALCGEAAGEGIEASPFHAQLLAMAQSDLMDYDLTVAPVNFYSTLDNRR
ncbi:hypothetical protein ACVIRO_001252 [Rhizobium ruizarguesonis]